MASIIHSAAHGFIADAPIVFSNLEGGDGIVIGDLYYVLSAGLTADDFEFSTTIGGTPFVFTTTLISATVNDWPQYQPIDIDHPASDDGIQTAPTTRSVGHTWPEAPGQPQNIDMNGGFKGFGLSWDATSVPDLMFYEVRYAEDDGSGSGPGVNLLTKLHTRNTVLWVDGLPIGAKFWAQVRSVDYTGNVVTSTADATAVDYLANLDAGWTALQSTVILAVAPAEVAFQSVIADIIATNQIDAGTINVGLLRLQVADATMADGMEVWSGSPSAGGIRLGYWDETGLYIGDAAGGVPPGGDLSAATYVKVTDAGLSVYRDGLLVSAITPDGINASAVTFGDLPGGHNLVQNSSFELSDFQPAATLKTWDVTADFTSVSEPTVRVSQTNTANSNNITASGLTY